MSRTVLNSQSGFTLVELLLCVAMLMVLGGLAVQAYAINKEKAQHSVAEQTMHHTRTAMEAGKADLEEIGEVLVVDQKTPGLATEGDAEILVPGLVIPNNARVYAFHNPGCSVPGCMEDYVLTRHCKINQRVVYFKAHSMPGTLVQNSEDPDDC